MKVASHCMPARAGLQQLMHTRHRYTLFWDNNCLFSSKNRTKIFRARCVQTISPSGFMYRHVQHCTAILRPPATQNTTDWAPSSSQTQRNASKMLRVTTWLPASSKHYHWTANPTYRFRQMSASVPHPHDHHQMLPAADRRPT
jgi:hypothetical protein